MVGYLNYLPWATMAHLSEQYKSLIQHFSLSVRKVWANGVVPDQILKEQSDHVYTVYHSIYIFLMHCYMSHDMTKPTKWVCAKPRLRSAWASAQSEQSSLSAWRNLGSLATHWAHSEDSDQTRQMPRLIWVFAGRTLILLVLTCRGSYSKTTLFKFLDNIKLPNFGDF